MELISLREVTDKYTIFQINDYTSSNVKHATAVAYGKPLGPCNDIKDLPAIYEYAFLTHLKDQIKYLQDNLIKFLFIIDITAFPFVACGVDTSKDSVLDDDSKFAHDMQKLYNNYDHTKIITIIVNEHLPHVGLKHISF